jgi:hypothetical protein
MGDDRLLWHSGAKGGRWVLSKSEAEYRASVTDLVPMPEQPIQLHTSSVVEPVSAELQPVVEAVIDSTIIEKITFDIFEQGLCVHIATYGISTDHLTDYVAIIESLDGVTPVGFGRYAQTKSIPSFDIAPIAAAFMCPQVEFISEDGEQVEDLIAPESYIGTLKTDVANPDNQDILDDASVYSGLETSQSYTFPLYKDHIAHGLIPLCRLDAQTVPWDVAYAPVSVHLDGAVYRCSVVNRDGVRFLTGLSNVFTGEFLNHDYLATVTKSDAIGDFALALTPLTDGEFALTPERCIELDVFRDSEADNPTVVILTQILDDHPKGISFERALRELRYIRRTSVHKLASILTTNDCFAQKPGTGVWRYNPKRADAGNDIARRTYLKSGF